MIKFSMMSAFNLCLSSTICTTSSIQTKVQFRSIETTKNQNATNFDQSSAIKQPTMDTTIEKLNAWYYSLPSNKINDYKKEINNFYTINSSNTILNSAPKYNISLNKNLILKDYNENIINSDIYNLLASQNYIDNINEEINANEINSIYIDNNKLNFNGDDDSNVVSNENSNDMWVISHWYWFGYWKLCISENISNSIKNILSKNGNAKSISSFIATLDIFTKIPLLKVVLNDLSLFLFNTNALNIANYDKGAGLYLGFLLFLPCCLGSLGNEDSNNSNSFDDFCYGWNYNNETKHNIVLADYGDYYNWNDYVNKIGAFIMKDFVCESGTGSHWGSGDNLKNVVKWDNNSFDNPTYFDQLSFNNKPIRVINYDLTKELCKQHAELNIQIINDEQHQKIILKTDSHETAKDSWNSVHTKLKFTKIEYFERNN